MTSAPHVTASSVEPLLTWSGVMQAIVDGHALPAAQLDDTLLRRGDDALLSRAAMIDGLGALVKTATVFPGNSSVGKPTVNGSVALFSDATGELVATIDFHLLTKWKTAADSLLAATRLARPNSSRVLIVGSGTVAESMIAAYRSVWPDAAVSVWSRTRSNAEALAERAGTAVASDLETAVREAHIVSTSTMSTEPLVHGDWLQAGQHLDLIGGYRPDMREADDACIRRASVFVDNRGTAADVGDIRAPLANGALNAIGPDFLQLADGSFGRSSSDEITLFKNAGGAHLDLMVASHMAKHAATSS
jgi:ornithine cyclodeaminase/alanine dehydrogenase-like protein (mu-crystallin family)